MSARLGVVVGGSLSEGIQSRLDPDVSVEELAVGRYLVADGRKQKFFCLLTDIELGSTSQDLGALTPSVDNPYVADVLAGATAFGLLHVTPMLSISQDEGEALAEGPRPVKTVPAHFSAISEASESDIEQVFGAESPTNFFIGTPLDMDAKVCLDLGRLTERSTGVFGKTGTGKTFLTRTLLAGLIRSDAAVSLFFDMHNDYGWRPLAETDSGSVRGLKELFRSKVLIYALDPKSSRRRGAPKDGVIQIAYDEVTPEDIEILREMLNINETQMETVRRLARIYGDSDWLRSLVEAEPADLDDMADSHNLNSSTLSALHRKLETRMSRFEFMVSSANQVATKVTDLIDQLNRGFHVVLEFGSYQSYEAYLLVANILTRRIHEEYVERVEIALGAGGEKPRPLVIVIEEAHKFLSSEVANLTTFGSIAREMRKYNVTLLVVDQRPSGIDDEVMSQIGTRITCLLDDEKDVAAVLSGSSGASSLRSVLTRLETKQQALIVGHAVPMPVVIRSRDYGPEEYEELSKFGSVVLGDNAPLEDYFKI